MGTHRWSICRPNSPTYKPISPPSSFQLRRHSRRRCSYHRPCPQLTCPHPHPCRQPMTCLPYLIRPCCSTLHGHITSDGIPTRVISQLPPPELRRMLIIHPPLLKAAVISVSFLTDARPRLMHPIKLQFCHPTPRRIKNEKNKRKKKI